MKHLKVLIFLLALFAIQFRLYAQTEVAPLWIQPGNSQLVDLSPDGKYILMEEQKDDDWFSLWDAHTGKCISIIGNFPGQSYPSHAGTHAFFSSNSKFIYFYSTQGAYQYRGVIVSYNGMKMEGCYSIDSMKLISTPFSGPNSYFAYTEKNWSSTNIIGNMSRRLAIRDYSLQQTHVWDISTYPFTIDTFSVNMNQISDDGMFVASYDYRINTGPKTSIVHRIGNSIDTMFVDSTVSMIRGISPDSKYFVTYTSDTGVSNASQYFVNTYNVSNDSLVKLHSIGIHNPNNTFAYCFLNDASQIVVATDSSIVRFIDLQSGLQKKAFAFNGGYIEKVDKLENGYLHIVSKSYPFYYRLRISDGLIEPSCRLHYKNTLKAPISANNTDGVSFGSNGYALKYSLDESGTASDLWLPKSVLKEYYRYQTSDSSLSLVFGEDVDNTIVLRDDIGTLSSKQNIGTVLCASNHTNLAILRKYNEFVLISYSNDSISILKRLNYTASGEYLVDAAISRNGKYVCGVWSIGSSVDNDSTRHRIRVIDVATGVEKFIITTPYLLVKYANTTNTAVSSDGKRVIINGSYTNRYLIFNMESGSTIKDYFSPQTDPIFSNDDSRIYSLTTYSIFVYDFATDTITHYCKIPYFHELISKEYDQMSCFAVSSSDKYFIAQSSNGSVVCFLNPVFDKLSIEEKGEQKYDHSIRLSSNPVSSKTNAQIYLSDDMKVQLSVVDPITGSDLLSYTKNMKKGNQTMEIDVASLRSGLYYVLVQGDKFNALAKLIVAK